MNKTLSALVAVFAMALGGCAAAAAGPTEGSDESRDDQTVATPAAEVAAQAGEVKIEEPMSATA